MLCTNRGQSEPLPESKPIYFSIAYPIVDARKNAEAIEKDRPGENINVPLPRVSKNAPLKQPDVCNNATKEAGEIL
ncbi:hypothetical protein INT43_006275 [Umbelopsis isabellina]|uniref:Uncharacterized protein n=1 Tax=Mortierella isabellina TaxID=91625 RepID=A0A8H7Q229_MORIS|nr:hypothetical protein INT43_006275 [Umbelopsis isabellina]